MSSSAINESPYNCTECGASKKSEEALELHLKVSHLKWLPFKCPKCTAQRALESQMRNHIQINNHGDPSKYIYINNLTSEQLLAQWMQLSRFKHATNVLPSSNQSSPVTPADKEGSTSSDLPSPATPPLQSPLLPSQPIKMEVEIDEPSMSPKMRPTSEDNGDVSFAAVVDQSNEEEIDCVEPLPLNPAKRVKIECDMWSSDGCSSLEPRLVVELSPLTLQPIVKKAPQRVSNRKIQCRKCKKKIPALDSLKKRHATVHLSTDYNINRFNCLFAGCDAKRYRKEQLERHQEKEHGLVDSLKIEDTIEHLRETIAEVVEDLFSSYTPATTNHLAASSSSISKSSRSANRKEPVARSTSLQCSKRVLHKLLIDAVVSKSFSKHCKLCAKMISTSRMQHMSWHLSKDADLNRYQCSQCDFGRYSGEKVRRHCKTYHKRTVKMLDKTVEYRDEMAAKMDECFGMPPSPTNSNELSEPQRVLRHSSYPPQVTCGVCAKSMSSKVRVQHVLLHLSRDKGINRYQCSKCDMGSDRRSFFKQHMKKEHAGAGTIIDNIVKHQEVYAALHEDCFGERKSPVVPNSKVMTQKRLTVQFKRETRSSLRLSHSLDQELSQSPDSVGGEEEIQVASSKQTGSKRKSSVYSDDCTCRMCLQPNVLDMKKHGLNHVLKPIFMCPHCNFNRQFEISGVKAHMRMKHPDSSLQLIDNSSLYADDIKKCLQFCFPGHFAVNEDDPRDAPLPAKSLEGSEEEWIVVKDATCAICNQLLPSTETVSRVHKFNQKLVRQKCWCGPRCAFGSLEPGWLHCSECADKLFSSHSFAFLMESRF